MNPGEYTAPMPRKTWVNCPVVSGYVTARLQAQDWFPPVMASQHTSLLVTFENVGNTIFTVQLNETSDRSTAGVRTALTNSSTYLVPGGQQTKHLQSHEKYLEVYCSGTTAGQLRMQIDSQRQWVELGFDRQDIVSTVGYPPALWQAKEVPGPVA